MLGKNSKQRHARPPQLKRDALADLLRQAVLNTGGKLITEASR